MIGARLGGREVDGYMSAWVHADMSLSHALKEDDMHQVVGILLAAGRGLRFDPEGRRDKLLERFDSGQTVLQQSALRLHDCVDRLVVVTRPGRTRDLQASCPGLEADWVEALDADLGMGASLKAGVGALPKPLIGWLISLADMPWILPQTYQQARQALERDCDLVRPVHHGQPGHPVGCASHLLEALMSLPATEGLASLFRRPGLIVEYLKVDDPGCTRDIDLLADLD